MILLLSFSMSSFAQPKPLLTEGKKWECGSISNTDSRPSVYYNIKVGEDTLVGNKACRKMYVEYTKVEPSDKYSLSDYKDYSFVAYEEGGRLYRYVDDIFDLYLDFNLKEGDELKFSCHGEVEPVEPDPNYKILKEDTIIVRGREYRRLTPGYIDKPSAYWVDGVGTSREFFLTLYLVPTNGGNLYVTPIMLACYENGECIFTKDDFNATATSVQSAKEDTKGECELYDIVGRKVSKPGKGKVYISKGKKHVAF